MRKSRHAHLLEGFPDFPLGYVERPCLVHRVPPVTGFRIVMPFSRAHFPSPLRWIRAPHTAVCLACLGTPIGSWSFIVTALSLDDNSWHPVRSSAAHGSPKRALPCFEPPIRDIRLDFISRARVWPGRGNKTTSAKEAQIVVATIAVRDAPTKQACQAVGSDNIR